jgi:hypothetical protein
VISSLSILKHTIQKSSQKIVSERVKREDINAPPLKFDQLSADWVMRWVINIRQTAFAEGIYLSFGTNRQNRAAIKHLIRSYRQMMPVQMDAELSIYFKGLQRQTAKAIGTGRGRVQTGKDPMSFTLYKRLCKFYFKSEKREHVFARTFMVICWNLMCRAANAVLICYSHIEWRGDALGIYFAHMKSDQTGESPRDATSMQILFFLKFAPFYLLESIFYATELMVLFCSLGVSRTVDTIKNYRRVCAMNPYRKS